MPLDTRTVTDFRTLRFESIDELLAEIDRIVAADQARALRRTGNWTAGQVLGHLAAWIEYGYEGYPPGMKPPWYVRIIVRWMRNRFITKPMGRGFRIPRTAEGTFGTQMLTTAEGAQRLRSALARLQKREAPRFHSPALGPLTDEERIALNLRHAELHLGYLHP